MLARRLTEITAGHGGRGAALADGPARAQPGCSRSRWPCTGAGEAPGPVIGHADAAGPAAVPVAAGPGLRHPPVVAAGIMASGGGSPRSRCASTSRWDARPSTSTASPRRGCAAAAQWHGKVALETGLLRWSTLNQRVFALTVLDAFLAGRGVSEPRLAADPARVRQLMLDFLGHVRASRASRGPTAGQPVSAAHAKTVLVHVEQFYLFMHDHKDAAAAATGEPGWRRAGSRARRVLPDPGTSPPRPARPGPGHHRRHRDDQDHGRDRPARRASRPTAAWVTRRRCGS